MQRTGCSTRPAFTLVELLIAIFIIGLLTVLIVTIASRASGTQKEAVTKTYMDTVKLAIDQFSTENPFRTIYDNPRGRSFGPLPPYVPAGDPAAGSNSVWSLVEPSASATEPPRNLIDRLWRDLGNRQGTRAKWVRWARSNQDANDADDDNRALYCYLTSASPGVLNQVPKAALKPLANKPEYLNPKGVGPDPGQPDNTWVDVLGLHDSWGVPFDYMLYVKLERGLLDSGATGWKVTDRRAVLRSHGVSREEFDKGVRDESKAIYSEPLSTPMADVNDNGFLQSPGQSASGGWVRVRAFGDTYKYRPVGN